MAHTKGKFKDGHTGWKVRVLPSNKAYGIKTGYEIVYNDSAECVTDYVYTADDANLIAAAPDMLSLLKKIYNIENGAFGLESFNIEQLKIEISDVINRFRPF